MIASTKNERSVTRQDLSATVASFDFSSMTEEALVQEINGHHGKLLSGIDPLDKEQSRKTRAAIVRELRQRTENRTPPQEAR